MSTKTGKLTAAAVSLALGNSFITSTTVAAEWTDRVRLNGFADAIYQATDEPVAIHGNSGEGGIDNRGNFTGTKLGVNLTAQINDRITLYTQLQGEHSESYKVHVDWAFMAIELSETFTLRTGNIKFPVGVVNEYIDTGYLYPWLQAPRVIYSQMVPNGPQAIRDSYSGASLLFSDNFDDWTLGADIFGGEVKMESADVRKTQGVTLRADWNDEVLIQASTYTGLMENATTSTAMNNQKHDVSTLGVKADVNNFVVYTEYASIKMGTLTNMKANTWYATLGYHFGKWLPFFNYEDFKKGAGNSLTKQNFSTIGLRYELMRNTALKMELSRIKTKTGTGMFESAPNDNSTNQFGIGLSVIF